jgi:hypothetical protein
MEPVTLIVTALASCASTAAGAAVSAGVQDAYTALKGLVSKRFEGTPAAEVALMEHEKNPRTWNAPLAQQLEATGATADEAILVAAKRLLGLADPAGSQQGKYAVTITGGQGVQVGDGNTQTNTFTTS